MAAVATIIALGGGTVVAPAAASAAGSPGVGDTIPVGNGPAAAAVDVSRHLVYVANRGSDGLKGSLSVIDSRTRRVTATIAQGYSLNDVAVDPVSHNVFALDSAGSGLVAIDESGDARTGTVTTIPVPRPEGLAVDPSSHNVYVSSFDDDTVSVIDESGDARTGRVIATVPIGGFPLDVAVDDSTHRVYVVRGTFDGSPTMSVIDESGDARSGTITGITGLGVDHPVGVAVDATTHDVYVTGTSNGSAFATLEEFDESGTPRQVADVTLGYDGGQPAVDPWTHDVYVPDSVNNMVAVVVPVTGSADVVVAVTGPSAAPDGSQFTERITLTNRGSSTASGVVTDAAAPEGLTVTADPGAVPNSVYFYRMPVWKDQSIPAGSGVTHTVTFKVWTGYHATIGIGAVETAATSDSDVTNNAAITPVRLG